MDFKSARTPMLVWRKLTLGASLLHYVHLPISAALYKVQACEVGESLSWESHPILLHAPDGYLSTDMKNAMVHRHSYDWDGLISSTHATPLRSDIVERITRITLIYLKITWLPKRHSFELLVPSPYWSYYDRSLRYRYP
ncbi:hypothetical protein EDD18DRAFT_798687 [Armillaria luteobubalina]|uniref:Uncharacterized protein n=1 Tax=Armillaria luteobubalina TaxID=153913 RepID=A0AA39PBE2_9AGAR|nr:hypothetical protein EDD18DRAFT_798687 [Armillaria luteobubalina]